MAACFVAGAAGDWEDEELERGVLGAGTLSFAIDFPKSLLLRCHISLLFFFVSPRQRQHHISLFGL